MCKINNYEFSHVLLGMKIYCFEFWVRYLSVQYLLGQSSLPSLKISHSLVQRMGKVLLQGLRKHGYMSPINMGFSITFFVFATRECCTFNVYFIFLVVYWFMALLKLTCSFL